MHYYGTRLSENISRREPEGYLLCLNVPVARTGTQEYLPEELGLSPPCHPERSRGISLPENGSGLISVYRPESEVFSPETIASFEGMPVTNDHPPEGVDISNIRALQKGHAHNVRRGTGEESDLLLADLIITDPVLIDLILAGKREISCGYTYELCEENGQYIQRKIRGNHVAVVDAGRAGARVSIKDEHPERRTHTMKKSLTKMLARMAKDGDVETVAEIIEEMIAPEEETAAAEEAAAQAPEPDPEPGVQNVIIDEDGLNGICERLDRIIALLETRPVPETDADPEMSPEAELAAEAFAEKLLGEAVEAAVLEAADPSVREVAAAMEEVLEPEFSTLLESREGDEESCLPGERKTGDAVRAAVAAIRPALDRMSPAMRRKVAGNIAAGLRSAGRRGNAAARASDTGIYAAMSAAGRRYADRGADLGRRIMEKRNPHCKR